MLLKAEKSRFRLRSKSANFGRIFLNGLEGARSENQRHEAAYIGCETPKNLPNRTPDLVVCRRKFEMAITLAQVRVFQFPFNPSLRYQGRACAPRGLQFETSGREWHSKNADRKPCQHFLFISRRQVIRLGPKFQRS